MKSNEELQKEVQNALRFEPVLVDANIGVTAQKGIITLFGKVDSYIKKVKAEEALKFVTSVKALVQNIEVFFDSIDKKKRY